MSDFEFLQNKISGKWVISAPRRSKRTNLGKNIEPICPFCPAQEVEEEELYRVGDADWKIRVVSNKFPFAPNHEVIVHSPDHHKNFDELPATQIELILQTYRQRFNVHSSGQTYIFHNSGSIAGASIIHPHTQLVVIPPNVKPDIVLLDTDIYKNNSGFLGLKKKRRDDLLETEYFLIFCPSTSEWPDEVWIAPKKSGQLFGQINDKEITDLSFVLPRLIEIFDSRHGNEFPYNFYIYPGKNWYIRLIPRIKTIGGFELGTNIIVNTQDPSVTFAFIKEHFLEPNHEKIKSEHQADYRKSV